MTRQTDDRTIRCSSALEAEIEALLLSGMAGSVAEAESLVLDAHLADIAELARRLTDDEFERHELVRLLMAHGSRSWEDSIH